MGQIGSPEKSVTTTNLGYVKFQKNEDVFHPAAQNPKLHIYLLHYFPTTKPVSKDAKQRDC